MSHQMPDRDFAVILFGMPYDFSVTLFAMPDDFSVTLFGMLDDFSVTLFATPDDISVTLLAMLDDFSVILFAMSGDFSAMSFAMPDDDLGDSVRYARRFPSDSACFGPASGPLRLRLISGVLDTGPSATVIGPRPRPVTLPATCTSASQDIRRCHQRNCHETRSSLHQQSRHVIISPCPSPPFPRPWWQRSSIDRPTGSENPRWAGVSARRPCGVRT